MTHVTVGKNRKPTTTGNLASNFCGSRMLRWRSRRFFDKGNGNQIAVWVGYLPLAIAHSLLTHWFHILLILESWLKKRKRKPLMVRGARQVGKSTLVRIFAELSSRPLAQINLERHTDLAALFSKNDPDALIDVLESYICLKIVQRSRY